MKKILIIAQNNCETSCAVWKAVVENIETFLNGINIVLRKENLDGVRLHVPEYCKENKALISLMPENVQIVYGFVDVRALEEEGLLYHPEQILAGGTDIAEKHIEIIGKQHVFGTADIADSLKMAVEKIYGEVPTDIMAVKAGTICAYPENLGSIKVADLMDAKIELISKDACIVQMAKDSAQAVYAGTCGKCTFCRETAYQVKTILNDITEGQSLSEDMALIVEMAQEANEESMCTFGQQGLQFAAGTVKLFAGDYEEHIKYKNCPAGVCKGFYDVAIDGSLCDGCAECAKVCEDKAVFGKKGYIHFIDTYDCTRCGKCIERCPQGAIGYVRKGRQMGPLRMISAGRYRTSRKRY